MIQVQGFAQYNNIADISNPIHYKTDVFEITNGTSVSEIYDYFGSNPTIYYLYPEQKTQSWGLNDIERVINYTQINNTWKPTHIPRHPHILKWNFLEVQRSDGSGSKPLVDVTTPLNNTKYYEAD